MSTREDEAEVAAQKRRDEEFERAKKILDDALTADLSHAKDKAEEKRLQKKYDEDVAALQSRQKKEEEEAERLEEDRLKR